MSDGTICHYYFFCVAFFNDCATLEITCSLIPSFPTPAQQYLGWEPDKGGWHTMTTVKVRANSMKQDYRYDMVA